MSRHPHKSLPFRPALDGLRAIAVTGVLIYHLNSDWLKGGWLGVDLFFVLSGFLITSLLLAEHRAWGSISLLGFWAARARRLLPSLFVVLLSVLVAASFWTLPSRREPVALDTLAAMFYVANWRLNASDEQYFNSLSLPSPLRHTWSLAIEEQFYLVVPLLLTGLFFAVRRYAWPRRRAIIAGTFALLAALSMWRMAALYVPGSDPTRVYYGTDTRAFELLIGVVAAVIYGADEFAGRRTKSTIEIPRSVLQVGSIVGLIGFLAAFALVGEQDSWLFPWGLAGMCLLGVLMVSAAASDHPFLINRLLKLPLLQFVGKLSYSLYLWHWPVIVFLNSSRILLTGVALAIFQVAVSVGLSYLTLRFVERPIRRGGFRALIPSRPRLSILLTRIAVPLLAIGVIALPHTGSADAAGATGNATSLGALNFTPPPYTPRATKSSVVFIGNSIPASVVTNFPAAKFPDLTISDSVNFGCDPYEGDKTVGNAVTLPTTECLNFRKNWPTQVKAANPDLAVFYFTQSFLDDYTVNGKRIKAHTPAHDAFIRTSLTNVKDRSLAAGAKKFAVVDLACHDMPFANINPEFQAMNDPRQVAQVNGVLRSWAAQNGVQVIDQDGFLCKGGYHDSINGVPLYQDGLHFTSASGPIYWQWLAPQLQQVLGAK